MAQIKLFFTKASGKDGKTYYKAKSRNGRYSAQLFEASSGDVFYTATIQLPKPKRKRKTYRKSSNGTGSMATQLAYLKGMLASKS